MAEPCNELPDVSGQPRQSFGIGSINVAQAGTQQKLSLAVVARGHGISSL